MSLRFQARCPFGIHELFTVERYGEYLWTSQADGVAVLSVGVLLMAGFVVHARRLRRRALIDLQLFGIRIFSTAAATQFFANAAFYATQFLIPLYLITGCARSASQAGWLVAALGAGMMCSFPFVGILTDRFGCRAVSAGGAVAALCGMFPFFWMSHSMFSAGVAGACLFVTGAGQGTSRSRRSPRRTHPFPKSGFPSRTARSTSSNGWVVRWRPR